VYVANAVGEVDNSGAISGPGNVGVDMYSGIVANTGAASSIYGSSSGVFIHNGSGTITNEGTIAGAHGINLAGGGTVNNTSSVTGATAGVNAQTIAASVSNSGEITATETGGAAIQFASGGAVTNLGTGSISGAKYGVFVQSGCQHG
jgi:hypothetical protein